MRIFFILVISNCLSLIREKKLLASSQDYGKDLPDAQNLHKKSQRLGVELKSYEPRIQTTLNNCEKYKENNVDQADEIQERCDKLSQQWNELNELNAERYKFFLSIVLVILTPL